MNRGFFVELKFPMLGIFLNTQAWRLYHQTKAVRHNQFLGLLVLYESSQQECCPGRWIKVNLCCQSAMNLFLINQLASIISFHERLPH